MGKREKAAECSPTPCPTLFLESILRGQRLEEGRLGQTLFLPPLATEVGDSLWKSRGGPWHLPGPGLLQLAQYYLGNHAPPPRLHSRPHGLRLSLFLHPRLGTKDFKFWLRCSSRGHQTSTTWKPGAHVTVRGKHGCRNTGSPG